MEPAVFLDRDNTLIHNDGDLGDPEQVRLIDGVASGLRALRERGFSLVVVTNQGGVARGRFTEHEVDAVHQRIAVLVDGEARRTNIIDRFYYCPYHPEATVPEYRRDHPWRKPHPGMILQAAGDMAVDLAQSWMIGDQERDVLAGRAAGCRTMLVTRDAELAQRVRPTAVAGSFAEAVEIILKRSAEMWPAQQNGPAAAASRPARPAAVPAPDAGEPPSAKSHDGDGLKRVITDLTEEIRADRLRRIEFTPLRMLAVVCQLLAVLLAVLGLLQVNSLDVFAKWVIGAVFVQLITMTLLVLDLKG